jgi:hypothetical protein
MRDLGILCTEMTYDFFRTFKFESVVGGWYGQEDEQEIQGENNGAKPSIETVRDREGGTRQPLGSVD